MLNPIEGDSIDVVEAGLVEAILRLAETLVSRRTRKRPRVEVGSDCQTEAAVGVAWTAKAGAWQRQKQTLKVVSCEEEYSG